MTQYSFIEKGIFYKHEITETPTREAYYMHTHNIFELLYFISGDASQIIEDKRYKLTPGDLILTRPFKYHYVNIDRPICYERFDILIDPELAGIDNIDLYPADSEIISVGTSGIARELFDRIDLYTHYYSGERLYDVIKLSVKELFYSLPTINAATGSGSVISPILTDALEYVNKNLFTIKDISEVSSALFVSPSYLYRLFAKELRKTPKEYIREKRLLAAEDLISKGAKPTEIFSRCGFLDYTVFYRNYKSFFGKSPSGSKLKI